MNAVWQTRHTREASAGAVSAPADGSSGTRIERPLLCRREAPAIPDDYWLVTVCRPVLFVHVTVPPGFTVAAASALSSVMLAHWNSARQRRPPHFPVIRRE
jgi:hypothetical protein